MIKVLGLICGRACSQMDSFELHSHHMSSQCVCISAVLAKVRRDGLHEVMV